MAWQDKGAIDLSRFRQQPQQPSKGFWTDQISTGGGIGGALGGAALGAAAGSVVPVVGTTIGGLLGAILGGAAGSGAGEFAENKITNEADPWKNVGKEALLGGVFSAPPIRGAKALYGAGKALTTGAGKTAAKEAAEQALVGPGMLSKVGAGLRGGARGVETGVKVGGARLAPSRAKEINEFIEGTIKAKGLTPSKQAESVEKFIASQNDILTGALEASNRALTKTEKNAISKGLAKKFQQEVLSPTPSQQRILNDLTTRVGQTKDVKQLDDLRKLIDQQINFSRNTASPDTAAEQVYKLFRSGLTDEVAGRAGGVKNIKTNLSKAFDAQDLLLQKSTGGFGQAQTSVGTIPIPRQLGQAAQASAGKLAGRLGRTPKIASPLGITGRQLGAEAVSELTETQQPQSLEASIASTMPTTIMPTNSSMGTSYNTEPQMSSPYSSQRIGNALMQALTVGDQPAIEQLSQMYELAQTMEASQQPAQTELTSSQATRAAAAQNALLDIPLIEQAIDTNLLGASKALPFASSSLGRRVLGTENLDAALFNIADNILRARSGAAAPEAEVQRFVDTFLPGPLDSDEAKKFKLERAVRELQGYVNPQQAANPALEEAIIQSQGGF